MSPGKSFDPLIQSQRIHFNHEGEIFDKEREDKGKCVCVPVCMCDRNGERVFSPIRLFTQPSHGTSRAPHCSPKVSTRRHCCCAASALNPPPTSPHRKQGYCPRDVTSETPTPARLLVLAPSRPQPIAMTTEKRIEYK